MSNTDLVEELKTAVTALHANFTSSGIRREIANKYALTVLEAIAQGAYAVHSHAEQATALVRANDLLDLLHNELRDAQSLPELTGLDITNYVRLDYTVSKAAATVSENPNQAVRLRYYDALLAAIRAFPPKASKIKRNALEKAINATAKRNNLRIICQTGTETELALASKVRSYQNDVQALNIDAAMLDKGVITLEDWSSTLKTFLQENSQDFQAARALALGVLK